MNTAPIYDKTFFIDYLSQIPDDKWAIGVGPVCSEDTDHDIYWPEGVGCVLYHCGARWNDSQWNDSFLATPMSIALRSLLGAYEGEDWPFGDRVPHINDGRDPLYQQPTPKARILAALNDLP